MDMMCNFLPGDPRLVEQIVKELKSQGIFDQFRKECISDVDTKPAYQNLRQRVEGSVSNFLQEQVWSPDMNKNQVREMLRKHINESGFLETGVERIVDQVVNPKINSVFIPKVDDVMYTFLGIDRPKDKKPSSLEINTAFDLLPKDLEAVSPELPEEKVLPKEEIDEDKSVEMPSNRDVNGDKILLEENSVDSQSSNLSGNASHDSNNSLKQDSVMSLNSSESRMSLSVNSSKIELEDTCLSQKSSDSNTKTDTLEEKICNENGMEIKEEMENLPETCSEKSSEATKTEEIKYKTKDKKRDKHHSSSDRSKSRNDRDKDKSRSDKLKKDDKERKNTEEKKYKIPKLSDKVKDNRSKDKDEKQKSEKGKSEKEKKYDKDKKSKYSSDKINSSSDKSKRDKSEKRDKDDKRDKKDNHKSDRSKDEKKSSSSKKRESNSSKDKDSHGKANKEEDIPDKNKNDHSSSSSTKDYKSRKDEDKSKASHRKDEKNDKEDRKRKRRSKDDHHSSKEKRNGGRSSDRDSDGPSNSKRPHVSPQNSNGDHSTQQTTQDSENLNSESSSGYSGNSDNVEEKHDEANKNALLEMQKIKIPKFASNLNEAMKIMKIRKLLKKLDLAIKTNPQNPEVQHIITDIEQLTRDVKKEKIQDNTGEENEEMLGNQKADITKSAPINIDEFISSSNISMAKWNALEAKFMEQITDVDYNSYESPYVDDEEVSLEQNENTQDLERYNPSEIKCEFEVTLNSEHLEGENFQKEFSTERIVISDPTKADVGQSSEENNELPNFDIDIPEPNSSDYSNATEQPVVSECLNSYQTEIEVTNSDDIDGEIENEGENTTNCKNFKQKAIVVLHKHALTEEMIKLKNGENTEHTTVNSVMGKIDEIEKENIEINKRIFQSENSMNDEKEKTFSREHTENNLILEESNSKNIEIYSLQNSCEVCLDNKGDLCKGFDQSQDLRPLNFIRCIMNILENEISRFKEKNIEYFSTKHTDYDYTQNRMVIGKTTDVTNNNSATETLQGDGQEIITKDFSLASKKLNPRTNSKTRTKFVPKENEHLDEMEVVNQTSEIKSKRTSGSGITTPLRANDQVIANKSIDKSSERKTRPNQRYSSEDLYKPRIFFRRSGRDSKNP